MLRKKLIFLLGIIVLSMFLFIQPMKGEIEIIELSPTADIYTEERGFGIQIRDYGKLQTYYWIDGDELRETYIQFNLPFIDNLSSIKLKLTEDAHVNNNITDFPIRNIDIEIFTSEDVLNDFLQDAYPERNLDVNKIKNICLEIAKKFGEYIYLLEIKKIYSSNRKRKHFVIDHFLSNTHSNLQLNIEMIEDHIKIHWNINIGEIKRSISRIKLKKYDPKMFANGHDYFRVLWEIKETELYELGPFPVESNYLNLAYFKCEKILKVNYSKPEIFNINFWNKICEAL